MISFYEINSILADDRQETVESLAVRANRITRQYFGRTISLYAPIYLSNYCENQCVYCGFNCSREINRKKLTQNEMTAEMSCVAVSGIQNALLLTGDSTAHTPLSYLKVAVETAKKYFQSISLEVYPMEVEEYSELFISGVDGVTVYQETYDRANYLKLHISGKKRDYDYRYSACERIAKSGIRYISMGVLLGLSDIPEDVYELFNHLEWMEKNYPAVEYSISFPRILPVPGTHFKPHPVSDIMLIKLICLARILFPRVGINLSTRENAELRDYAIELGVTRISAASKTSVGGYTGVSKDSLQFDVKDNRSVGEIISMLKAREFDPILTDWRRIENGP